MGTALLPGQYINKLGLSRYLTGSEAGYPPAAVQWKKDKDSSAVLKKTFLAKNHLLFSEGMCSVKTDRGRNG